MGRLWIATVLLLGVIGCSTTRGDAERDNDRTVKREVIGDVVFEWYTVDMSFGYKLTGTYITSDGRVWSYERTAPWYPERIKAGELSRRDMLTKHSGATQIGTVDVLQLRDISTMIKPAAKGPISRYSEIGAGSGSVELAYLYDPPNATYYEVLLSGQGERVASNAAPEARLLLDYIHEVQGILQPPAPR